MRQGLDLVRIGRFVVPVTVAAVAGAFVGAASAQDGGREGGQAEPPRPLLSGPEVEAKGPPGVVEGFGEGAPGRMMGAEVVPPRVLNRILEGMLSPDAPEEVRLSAEQRETVQALRDAFEEERRAYMQEHADELRELRRRGNVGEPESDRPRGPAARRGPEGERPRGEGRPRRGPAPERDGMERDGRPRDGMETDRPDREPTPEQNAARQRLREVMSGAPGAERLYADVWQVLTEAQQEHVEAQVSRFRDQMAERRREQYIEREMRDMRGRREGEGRPGADRAAPGQRRPMADTGARRERLIEIFNSMSPEEQVQLIDRLERAMADRSAERRGVRGPAEKPAPGVDGVRVPPPEEGRDRRPPRRD